MSIQPYQILFPIGLLYAIWGALLWVFFVLGWIEYPADYHAHLMIGGFLFSFALGFMMTAVPKFTGAEPAKKWELQTATLLAIAPFYGMAQNLATGLILLFLIGFFLTRYLKRTHEPPKQFIFIPIGLCSGVVGSMLLAHGDLVGKILLYQGTMLAFVLGVGGKLVGALLGWSDLPLVQISHFSAPEKRFPSPHIFGPALLLVLGLVLESTQFQQTAKILRALSATWIALSAWKIYRLPRTPGRLARWLWISCLGLVSGAWLYALVPMLGVHALHLMFMSGFGLMTIVIASRVSLAHGGYDLELELKSKTLRWSGIFILLAAMTRVSAPLTPAYFHHLAYAAIAWMIGMVIWFVAFFPKITRHANSA